MGFDIAVGIMLLLGAARGFKKGFARQALTVTSLIVAFSFASPLAERLRPYLQDAISNLPKEVADSVLFTSTLLAMFLLLNGFGTLYLYVYRTRSLGVNVPSLQDRLAGTLMGAVVAAFVSCVLLSLFSRLPVLIRENDMVKTHYQASRAVKLAEEYEVAPRVWNTEEVQRAYQHAGRLAEYFRPSNDSSDESQT